MKPCADVAIFFRVVPINYGDLLRTFCTGADDGKQSTSSLDHRAIELKQNGYKASPFISFKHRAFPPSASVYGAITQASSLLVERDLHFSKLTTRFVSSNFRFSQLVAFVMIN